MPIPKRSNVSQLTHPSLLATWIRGMITSPCIRKRPVNRRLNRYRISPTKLWTHSSNAPVERQSKRSAKEKDGSKHKETDAGRADGGAGRLQRLCAEPRPNS